jgi:hypothetical protein
VLSNTTAGTGVPIAGSAVPGGIVGDWVPRFREEVPVVRRKPKGMLIVLFWIESDAPFEVSEFKRREYILYVNGTYFSIGFPSGEVEWRTGGEVRWIGTATVTPAIGGGSIVASASNFVGNTTVSSAGEMQHAGSGAVRFDYSATVEATASADLIEATARAYTVDGAAGAFDISVTATAVNSPVSDSISGSHTGTFDNVAGWRANSSATIGTNPGTGTATASISISNVEVAYQYKWDEWAFTDGKQWVVWIFTEELNTGTTGEYREARFYGWTGRKSSATSTKVYARREYQDGSFTYAEAPTDTELVFDTEVIVLADFFENSKTWKLAWDGGTAPGPCESDYSGDTYNLNAGTLYEIYPVVVDNPIDPLLDILALANGSGGQVYAWSWDAVANGGCTIDNFAEKTLNLTPYSAGTLSGAATAVYFK